MTSIKKPKFKKKKLSALSAGIAAALGMAQGIVVQAEEPAMEEIVVTGSYIRRSGYEGAQNLHVLGAEQIELTGATQLGELVHEFSVNSGSWIGAEDNHGMSQFNIRNLGTSSTLTLINGKRPGLASIARAGNTHFNVNNLPLNIVERVEVLADGASALYGSQAVGGVANIITRKGFEGFEVTGGYSDATIDTRDVSVAVGSALADGRGHFNFYATYLDQDRAWRTDFDWLREYIAPTPEQSRFLSSQGSPGSYRIATLDQLGNAIGRGDLVPDPDCLEAGGVMRSATDNRCRYDFTDQRHLIASEERYSTFAEFDYQISDGIRYYNEIGYTNSRIGRSTGGEQFLTGQSASGRVTVPADHPFNFWIEDPADPDGIVYIGPEAWDNDVHTAVDLEALMRPLGSEAFRNEDFTGFAEVSYSRILNGFEVQLTNSWVADLSYSYAREVRVDNIASRYRSDEFQDLVKAGEWNPFGTAKANPTLVSPKDGVSIAGNSEITRDRWLIHGARDFKMTEIVVDLVATGDTFEMDGRMVQAAVGAQYRDVDYEAFEDPLDSSQEGNLNRFLDNGTFGKQQVWALFGEVYLPVRENLDLQLAARYEDYGDGLDTADPKISVDWRPLDWLGLRASWGTSFQAPNVNQTARTAAGSFVNDPASPDSTGTLVCVNAGISNGIATFTSGGTGLEPQSSDTYNLGVVFRFDNGLDASLDFWEFDYEDLIAAPQSPQAIINNDCTDDGVPNDPRILRSGNGQLTAVFTEFENIGSVVTRGVDLNFNYATEIGPGTLTARGGFTYVDTFEVDKEDGSPKFDGAGSRNFTNNFRTMPQLRGSATATYRWGDNSISGTFRYIDDYENDQSNNATIDSMETFDIQYSRVFADLIGPGDMTLTIGVNNVTDEDPPALVRNFSDGTPRPALAPSAGGLIASGVDRPGYDDYAGHTLIGRVVYGRFTYDF